MMQQKIDLWGDSIGKGVIWDEKRGRYCLCPRRCVRLLQEAGLRLESHARFGATIREGYADFCATVTEPGGVAVFEYGGNDCDLDWDAVSLEPHKAHAAQVPLAEFQEILSLMVREARRRGLRTAIVTPPPLQAERFLQWVSGRSGRDMEAIRTFLGDVEHIYRWQERYACAAREVAEHTGSRLIDLRTAFLEAEDFPALMCVDGMHPSEAGQELMARYLLTALDAPSPAQAG